jgi:chromosome partitioning protein
MIVVVGSNKGGVSKTTTCINIAIGLTLRGKEVIVLDADFQGSFGIWNGHREEAQREPVITMANKYGNLVNTVASLANKYEHVLIDVAGRNSQELITSMVVADIVIAPHQSGDLDIATLKQLRKQYAEISLANPKLRVLIYQTIGTTHAKGRIKERAEFLKDLADYPEFEVLNSISRHRQAYKDSVKRGLSVLEYDDPLAKEEINDLLNEVFHD